MIKENSKPKNLFLNRALAFILDMFIVSMISSLIAFPFVDNDKLTSLETDFFKLQERQLVSESDVNTFIADGSNLLYKIAYTTGPVTIVTLFVELIYFVIYQFKNNGQTFGKKLMKIKVISVNDNLSRDQLLFRSLIINSVLIRIILFIFVMIFKAKTYYMAAVFVNSIHYIVFILTVCFALFSKDGRGLHDRIAYTKVIEA